MDTTTYEHVDILIVGAGLSGIGAACRLRRAFPRKTFAVLEGRDAMGGTWDLFRYPGVRSDSDMYTLSYPFRPWTGDKSIVDGPSILAYLQDTAREHGVDGLVRYRHRAERASWSSVSQRWTVSISVDGDPVTLTCRFLYICTGYYRYDSGYAPALPGIEKFAGQVIHPQDWPRSFDPDGRRIVVVGSGATAVTLVPALARQGAQVTMLQRSPSYLISLPSTDPLANWVRRHLPAGAAQHAMRWISVLISLALYQLCQRVPSVARHILRAGVAKKLPGYALDPDFTPSYEPWDERLCVVADGDLFASIRAGQATVVTGHIRDFTAGAVTMESGQQLVADTVISATGLELLVAGGMTIDVDGQVVDPGHTVLSHGFLLSGVPNLAVALGYSNASWTLRADLVAQRVCRLLEHMDRHAQQWVMAPVPGPSIARRPLFPLRSGYIRRAAALLPQQGDRRPWRVRQNYPLDVLESRLGDVTEGLAFSC